MTLLGCGSGSFVEIPFADFRLENDSLGKLSDNTTRWLILDGNLIGDLLNPILQLLNPISRKELNHS
jgi:hypothetical protein